MKQVGTKGRKKKHGSRFSTPRHKPPCGAPRVTNRKPLNHAVFITGFANPVQPTVYLSSFSLSSFSLDIPAPFDTLPMTTHVVRLQLASYCLTCYAGLTQREVAEYLNVGTGSAVGKQMKQLVNERGKDRKLAKLMECLETGLKHAESSKSLAAKS